MNRLMRLALFLSVLPEAALPHANGAGPSDPLPHQEVCTKGIYVVRTREFTEAHVIIEIDVWSSNDAGIAPISVIAGSDLISVSLEGTAVTTDFELKTNRTSLIELSAIDGSLSDKIVIRFFGDDVCAQTVNLN